MLPIGDQRVGLAAEQLGEHLFGNGAVGPIQPEPALFLDDLALGVERRLIDLQERHALGFEPERQFELVGRQFLHVDGLIERRVGVAVAARAADVLEMILRPEPIRAAEHHVLEHVGEALPARLLVLGADVIPELHGDDRCARTVRRDHPQAVLEHCLPDRRIGGANGVGAQRQCAKGGKCSHHVRFLLE